MQKFKIFCAAGVLIVSLTACAFVPDKSDFMRQHATDEQVQVDLQRQLAKDWTRGSELVVSGEKRVIRGKAEFERGQKEISEGTALMEESERLFREKFPNLKLEEEIK